MLRIIKRGRYLLPRITCDTCGRVITAGVEGDYLWALDSKGQPVDGKIYHTHKGGCLLRFEGTRAAFAWGAEELTRLPGFLAKNLDVPRV